MIRVGLLYSMVTAVSAVGLSIQCDVNSGLGCRARYRVRVNGLRLAGLLLFLAGAVLGHKSVSGSVFGHKSVSGSVLGTPH